MFDCVLSAHVTVPYIIDVIIGVNRGAITKERKRSEERSRNQTKEATQEAEREKKTVARGGRKRTTTPF